jgi:hypothetical protein
MNNLNIDQKDAMSNLTTSLGGLANAFEDVVNYLKLVKNSLGNVSSISKGGQTRGKRRKTRSKRQRRTRKF